MSTVRGGFLARKQDENLIPNSARTPSERRKNATKAGIASGKERESSIELPFFEYKPDKEYDKFYCGCGGWD